MKSQFLVPLSMICFVAASCVQPAVVITVVVTEAPPGAEVVEPPSLQPTEPPPTWTPTRPLYEECSQATAGEFVTCRIQRAHCDYRPDVSGAPTFCNDAPFGSHSFTLLVWGEDWSDYDGRCLTVTGLVTRYRGLPQIEATSRSQVDSC